MTREFEHRGKWWLPAQEDSQIDGSLTYSPDDGAILELSGAFGDLSQVMASQRLSTPRLILGTTASRQEITLVNCVEKHRSLGVAYGAGYATSSYQPQVVLVGCHFQNYEALTFARLHVRYSHLDAWAGLRHFDFAQEEGITKISYSRPEPIPADLGGGVTVSVTSAGSEHWEGSPTTRVTIEREARIGIQIGEQAHLERFLKPIRLTQIFLSLAVGAAVHPVKVTGTRQETLGGAPIARSVDILYHPALAVPLHGVVFPTDMTFTLAGITDRFEPFLRNWFQTAELLGPVVNLYFTALAETGISAEHRFLTLCQALESLHRRRHGGQYLSRDEYAPAYDQLIGAIPDWIAPDHRAALVARLKYGHQFSLRKRLTDIFSAHDPVLRDVFPDPPAFINKVVKTRNYFTHYDEDDKQDAATGGLELHRLATKVRTLIEVCLLSEIGFTSEELRKQAQAISSRRVIEAIEYE